MVDGKSGFALAGALGAEAMTKLKLQQQKSMLQNAQRTKQMAGQRAGHDPEKVKQAASQFEAMMLGQMMKAMWKTVPKGGLLSGSREEELYRDMLNEKIAEEISKGQGIGIKEVITRELNHSSSK